MTTLIATSVVRGSQQGESHGGVYLIDLDRERVSSPVDWNTVDIDWHGRGWDRGLRGIEFDGDKVYIAASDELFVYAPDFRPLASYRNSYLKHCHEICRYRRRLFLASTGYDSILGFDLDKGRFSWGLSIIYDEDGPRAQPFNPATDQGPLYSNKLHINNVFCNASGMYISGLRTGGILFFDSRRISRWIGLPHGIHNARPFRDGVLFNDSQADAVRFLSRDSHHGFHVPRYSPDQLTHTDLDDTRTARQAFARGLCVIDEKLVATGSSPSTVTLHDLDHLKSVRMVTLSMDIRNAIHGLEVWPYT
ncbi:MAG: hypothetical protein HYY36_05290 [Gammaproteobacteria bacterium]|nr:hypothetical protein [Gammaproteobacteria bacterium]